MIFFTFSSLLISSERVEMDPISAKDFEIAVGMPAYESVLFVAFGHFLLKENRTGISFKNIFPI